MAAHPPVDLVTELRAVTVFQDRAQLTYGATVSLGPGTHVLSVKGKSWYKYVDRNTVQVRLQDADVAPVRLRSVGFVDHTELVDKRSELQGLEDQLRAVTDKLQDVQDRITVLERKSDFADKLKALLCNAKLHDPATKPQDLVHHQSYLQDPSKWAAMADFIATTKYGIAEEKVDLDGKADHLQREKRRLQKERDELSRGRRHDGFHTSFETSIQATVEVLAEAPEQELQLLVMFVVNGAGWTPSYDLRVQSEDSSMEVSYYAHVRQETGIEWNNIRLRLSTATPHIGGSPPSLRSPWKISLKPPAGPALYAMCCAAPGMLMQCDDMDAGPAVPRARARAMRKAVAAPVEEATSNVGESGNACSSCAFDIPGLVNVHCDNKPIKVTIARRRFPVDLTYVAVPQKDARTFLVAKTTNDTDFELLPGVTNVFYDSTFVNNSQLGLVSSGAEFSVSLGADEAVKVIRKRVQRHKSTSKYFLGGTWNCVNYAFTYVVTGSHSKNSLSVVVRDHYPLSSDKDVVVELTEPSDDLDKHKHPTVEVNDMHEVEWKLQLPPHEEVRWRLAFRVTYPEGMEAFGLGSS